MNKAYLVALREYMENLKTKTFWLGIMIFPVILVLSFLVPIWLEKSKDVRHYVVIDKSGRLLEAVEKRAAMPDMEKVFEEAVQKYRTQSGDFDQLPEVLRKLTSALVQGIDMHVVSELGKEPGPEASIEKRESYAAERDKIKRNDISELSKLFAMLEEPEGQAIIQQIAKFDPELSKVSSVQVQQKFEDEFMAPIKKWWQDLPPKEAQKYGSGLSKSRYARIDMDANETDLEKKLNEMLNQEKLFAYFVIGEDPVGKPGSNDTGGHKYVSKNLTDTDLKNWFSRLANAVISERRIREAKIPEESAKWIQAPLHFEAKQVSAAGEEEAVKSEDKVRQWAPVVFVYLLWISVFVIAQMLLTNTIEEKSNKIMEVLLSSVSPMQLMAGKIAGIAGTGLTMVLSWIFFFLLGIKLMPYFLPEIPDIDFGLIARDPIYLSSFVAYFILGYLFLASILVGIGSVCNSLKEAQNLMGPVTIIMIVPLLAMMPIGQDPNGTIAKVLSYVPPFTPFVMMNRAAGPPTPMEYVLTTILLVVSIAFTLWAAAKVFRVGILMTGKPPKIMEILRWIRAPVGHIQVRKEEE